MTSDAGTVAAAAGLGCAASWGAGDFSGGLAARSDPAPRVVLLAHAGGGVLFALAALAAGEAVPSASDLAWGAAAGLSLCAGTLGLYRGLAVGPMSLVAPVTGALAALIPVAIRLASGAETIGPARAAGLALALAGVGLVSRSGADRAAGGSRQALTSAVVGGAGFGGAFASLAQTSPGALFLPLAVSRLASSLAIVFVVRRAGIGLRPAAPGPILAAVACDSAGNALYVAAAHTGLVVVAVVFSSLYPAFTVLLALILLRERPRLAQWSGLACVVAAVALIA